MTTEKKKDPARVLLKNVRLSYPSIYKAKPFGGSDGDGQGEPKFSAVGLMDPATKIGKANIAKLEDAIEYVKKATWPKGAPKFSPAKICLKDSEDLEEMKDGYDGMMYVTASNGKKPRVLDIDGQDVREGDEGAPYAGCYVNMIVRVWGQDNKYGKRINASLEGVKFRDDGEAFGAAPIDADDFEDDDEDERPSRRRSRDDDEDDKPKRRSRDDDEDERPKRRSRDDDEDEKPKRRSRDEDEDERPKRRSRDDDEDERPKRRSRDDDEDERPKRRSRDDEDEERAPRRRSRDEEDDEPPPRRRRGRDDDVA